MVSQSYFKISFKNLNFNKLMLHILEAVLQLWKGIKGSLKATPVQNS